jgi:glutaredoxin
MTMRLSVVFYTRGGCHLCDDALAVLKAAGISPKVVDVDLDPALAARHGERVPVVEINGRERFFGRVDPVLLRRIVESEGLGHDS